MLKLSYCNSCHARIHWLPNDATGRKAPIDADPVPNGPVVIDDFERYHVLHKGEEPKPGQLRYTNHFQTCPNAAKHKKGGR